jgi:F0F1-type ATP synthase assembly protein I
MNPEKPKQGDPFIVAWGVYGAVGFQLAATVIGGLLLGQWLDKKWGTSPWLTLAGMIIGMVGGFYNLIRIATWHQERKEKKGIGKKGQE